MAKVFMVSACLGDGEFDGRRFSGKRGPGGWII